MNVIHLPQCKVDLFKKISTILLEVMFIPAAIIALLGGSGEATIAIIVVFAWRIIAAFTRWAIVGLIPATSVLTFALLFAKTGFAATISGFVGEKEALQVYLLPGCLISFVAGVYFLWQAFAPNPITVKLAKDFVHISDESVIRLRPLFVFSALTVGVLHIVSAVIGAWVVMTTAKQDAAVWASVVGVTGDVIIIIILFIGSWLILRKLDIQVSFKPVVTAPPETP